MVTSYEVKYEKASPREPEIVSEPVYIITNLTEITLSKLAEGSTYSISVAARSGSVYGELEIISATTGKYRMTYKAIIINNEDRFCL